MGTATNSSFQAAREPREGFNGVVGNKGGDRCKKGVGTGGCLGWVGGGGLLAAGGGQEVVPSTSRSILLLFSHLPGRHGTQSVVTQWGSTRNGVLLHTRQMGPSFSSIPAGNPQRKSEVGRTPCSKVLCSSLNVPCMVVCRRGRTGNSPRSGEGTVEK